jgi:hypothetical protein
MTSCRVRGEERLLTDLVSGGRQPPETVCGGPHEIHNLAGGTIALEVLLV